MNVRSDGYEDWTGHHGTAEYIDKRRIVRITLYSASTVPQLFLSLLFLCEPMLLRHESLLAVEMKIAS